MTTTTSTNSRAAIAAITAALVTPRRSLDSASREGGHGPGCEGCCGVDGGTPPPPSGQLGPPLPPEREGCHAGPPSALVLGGGGGIVGGGGIPGDGVEALDPRPGAGPAAVAPGAVVVAVAGCVLG